MNFFSGYSDITVVQGEGMGQLSVDPEHAGRPNGSLVLKIAIHQGSQVEAAKVPYSIKEVVYSASNRVVCAQDYKEKGKDQLHGFTESMATYCRKILQQDCHYLAHLFQSKVLE